MKKILITMLIPFLLSLSGCVIVAGDHDGEWDQDSWESTQKDNRRAISQLQIGTARQDVLNVLGEPSFSESFQDQGKNIQVYYYRTHRSHGDGKTTRDETTPVVFVDDLLSGWGSQALNQAMGITQ